MWPMGRIPPEFSDTLYSPDRNQKGSTHGQDLLDSNPNPPPPPD